MNRIVRTLMIIVATGSIGCASYGNYSPTVDPYNDANAHRISQDEYECRGLARRASGGAATESVKGGLVGGLLGAATGAAIGAAAGDPGRGAAVGAAAGGMGGATYNGLSADARYKRSFQTCMRNRGHNVID